MKRIEIELERLQRADLEQVDRRLAMLGRMQGALLIRLGDALSVMKQKQGYRRLGVSRFCSYGQQRVQRKQRFIDDTVRLADRLRGLPLLRAAAWNGEVLPSMAELVARHATVADDAAWTAIARDGTVRAVRALIQKEKAGTPPAVPDGEEEDPAAPVVRWGDGVDRGLATAASMRVDLEAGHAVRGNGLAIALLGEAQGSLPPCPLGIGVDSRRHEEILKRRAETRERHEREEAAAERLLPRSERIEVMEESPLPHSVYALDRLIVSVAQHLAALELEVGRLALRVLRDRAYERLGFATEQQYAKERVGMSLRSLEERMALARKCRALPALAQAVRARRIGLLVAGLIGGRARSETVEAWIARAETSTVKHIREDVQAADALDLHTPPTDEEREILFDFERSVLGGRLPQMSAGARQAKAPSESIPDRIGPGRIWIGTSESWRDEWLMMEQRWRLAGSPRGTFLRFACVALLEAWPIEDTDFAFKEALLRDRYTCAHLMCSSREPTPHHLRFRAHGGTDDSWNIGSLCYFCHIELVHQYLARVTGHAPDDLTWWLGDLFVVEGRRFSENAPPLPS